MILSELKQYLSSHKTVSMKELSEVFSVEPSALKTMIEHLEAKGYVETISKVPNGLDICGTCSIGKKCMSCPFFSNVET